MPRKKNKEYNHSADFSVTNLLATKKPKPTHRRLFSDPSKSKIINEMTYSPLVVETGSSAKKKETSEYSFKKGKNTKTTNDVLYENCCVIMSLMKSLSCLRRILMNSSAFSI